MGVIDTIIYIVYFSIIIIGYVLVEGIHNYLFSYGFEIDSSKTYSGYSVGCNGRLCPCTQTYEWSILTDGQTIY